uniref:RNA-directed DNA polymerase, eukaryota, reverse transcriptase zinc-binding domain protein n=1 Tax=Tanacetum cinerariifolium TaxID=118510 RepID=A0A699JKR2_TANCI|nr:hypothetical protein [Tanacetum cinerariifolium]
MLKGKLKAAQSILDNDPHNLENKMEAIKLFNEYISVAEDELKLLHQKAKIQWLKEGDRNTAYFHRILKTWKHKGRVEFICGEDGSRHEGGEVAVKFVKHFDNFLKFVKHFHNFLRTKSPVISMNSLGDIVSLKLSEEEAAKMIREVNDKEIKEIVRKDICKAIKEFFITGKILREINATLIVLVHKIDTPEKVSYFRPIACCNVIYKIIRVTKGLQQEEWIKKMCNED